MTRLVRFAAALGLVALTGAALAGGTLKSGPQVGQAVPGQFEPLNVTGPWAGQEHCLYCEYGANPVALIFARNVSPGLTKLIKKIDAATVKHKGASLSSFVVFLSKDAQLKQKLEELAKKEGIQNIVLTIDTPAGPEDYKVAEPADVTVVLYVDATVKSNRAFTKGQLSDQAIDQIVADLSKILPKK